MSARRIPEALWVALAFALALAAAHASGQSFLVTLLLRMMIFALAAVSLSFLIGQAGLVSFGHAAPFGLGAYAVLIAQEAGLRDVFALTGLALGAGALFSVLTGFIVLKTRGTYFIMITLAFAQMMFYVFSGISDLGGDDGMALAARARIFGERWLRTDFGLGWYALACLTLGLLALERLSGSAFGLTLRASRFSEAKVRALGVDLFRPRLLALALAGALAGIAGALMAQQSEYVSPSLMNWTISGELIVMVVLGGYARLSGAVIGAVLITAIEELFSHFTVHGKLGLGLILVAVVLARAHGLIGATKEASHG